MLYECSRTYVGLPKKANTLLVMRDHRLTVSAVIVGISTVKTTTLDRLPAAAEVTKLLLE